MNKYNRNLIALTFLICGLILASPAAARRRPSGIAIAQRTKAALEPNRPSTRNITVRIFRGSKQVMRWTGVEARDSINNANYMVTVMLAPIEARGFAVLSKQADNRPPLMWTYVPAVHRVEMLAPSAEFAPLFGADFSYSDLGFMTLNSGYNYEGEEIRNGVKTYKLVERPTNNPYYTKIVAWIRQSDFLPLERDFYDYAAKPAEIETYPEVRDIEGIPTVTRIRMVNVHSGDGTEFDFSDINYGNRVPAALFNPENLPIIASEPSLNRTYAR